MQTTDGGAEVGARWHASFSAPSGYQHHVRFSALAEIDLSDPQSMTEIRDDWITPLHRIVALATGRTESITWLRLKPESATDERGRQVFGSGITQEPCAAEDAEIRRVRPAFRCYNGGPTLLDLCRAWQRATQEHHPLVETFGAFLQVEWEHPRPQLLLLVQALEGLHDHVNREQILVRTDEHQTMRSLTREALKKWDAPSPEMRKFARANIPPRPPTNLATSLREVVSFLPAERFADKFTSLELIRQVIDDPDLNADDWASALRVVRNSLSNGVRGWDANVLRPAADLLDQCCRAHLMMLLGVPTDLVETYLARV